MSCPVSQVAQTTCKTQALAGGAQPHQLLAVSEHRKSGLILCQRFHAEFAGPGAAVFTSVEQPYTAVIAVGSPEVAPVMDYSDRQKAYSRRIQWIRWLEKIADSPQPTQRAEKLLYSFEAFFNTAILASLPDPVLALLAGVLPQTITSVRAQHRHMKPEDDFGPEPSRPSVCILNPHTLQPFEGGAPLSLAVTSNIATLCPMPNRSTPGWHAQVG
jgi:hypothetical protein